MTDLESGGSETYKKLCPRFLRQFWDFGFFSMKEKTQNIFKKSNFLSYILLDPLKRVQKIEFILSLGSRVIALLNFPIINTQANFGRELTPGLSAPFAPSGAKQPKWDTSWRDLDDLRPWKLRIGSYLIATRTIAKFHGA